MLEKYSKASDTAAGRKLYNLFMNCFDLLPLVAVIQEKVFVCHGGLFRMDGVTLKHIEAVRRRREPPLEGTSLEDKIYEDLIWSDPRPTATYPGNFFLFWRRRWWCVFGGNGHTDGFCLCLVLRPLPLFCCPFVPLLLRLLLLPLQDVCVAAAPPTVVPAWSLDRT